MIGCIHDHDSIDLDTYIILSMHRFECEALQTAAKTPSSASGSHEQISALTVKIDGLLIELQSSREKLIASELKNAAIELIESDKKISVGLNNTREFSAMEYRLNESMSQVFVLSKQVADAEEEIWDERNRFKLQVKKNEILENENDLLKTDKVELNGSDTDLTGIISSLTLKLQEVRYVKCIII